VNCGHGGVLMVGLSVGDGEIWAMKKGMRSWGNWKASMGDRKGEGREGKGTQ
jgi:hypothetical protein